MFKFLALQGFLLKSLFIFFYSLLLSSNSKQISIFKPLEGIRTPQAFLCFQWAQKCKIGLQWVNIHNNLKVHKKSLGNILPKTYTS